MDTLLWVSLVSGLLFGCMCASIVLTKAFVFRPKPETVDTFTDLLAESIMRGDFKWINYCAEMLAFLTLPWYKRLFTPLPKFPRAVIHHHRFSPSRINGSNS